MAGPKHSPATLRAEVVLRAQAWEKAAAQIEDGDQLARVRFSSAHYKLRAAVQRLNAATATTNRKGKHD